MKKIILTALSFCVLMGCDKSDTNEVFAQAVTERIEQAKQELRQELTDAPYGWKVAYFPKNTILGGFAFLMKFNANEVTMLSDAENIIFNQNDIPQETGLYKIKSGQTITLSFTTKNHIHKLAEPLTPNFRGTGYFGEFDFLYFGKEDNRLKFRTQKDGNFVYFEKATEQDWLNFNEINKVYNDFRRKPYLFETFSTNEQGEQKKYRFTMNNRRRFSLVGVNDSQNVGISIHTDGIYFSPEIQIDRKKFGKLQKEENKYVATVEGVTLEIVREIEPEIPIASDDTKDINTKISGFALLVQHLKNNEHTSQEFKKMLSVSEGKDLFMVRIEFIDSQKVRLDVMHNFDGSIHSLQAFFPYEVRDGKLFFGLETDYASTDDELWAADENEDVFLKAMAMIVFIQDRGTEGFFVEKIDDKVEPLDNDVYLLKTSKSEEPQITIPMWGIPI